MHASKDVAPRHTSRARWWLAGAVALLCALIVAWAVTGGRVEADVASYAGLEGDAELAPVLKGLASSELARSVVLLVERLDEAGGIDREASRADAAAIAERLARHDAVAWVRVGPDDASRESFHALYWPRRMALREDDPERIDVAFTDAGLRAAADAIIEALRGPTSALVSRIATDDPFLTYPALLRRFEQAAAGTLTTEDGAFITSHGAAVVLLASRASPFERAVQAPLEAELEAAIAARRATSSGRLVVRRSGVGRFAVAAEASIRRESTLYSTMGLLGVVLTLLVVFGRARDLVATLVPLALALLVGAATTLLVFGRVHVLTLGFGGMLVGVVVDYPLHVSVQASLGRDGARGSAGPVAWRKTPVVTGILLGAATTLVGFAALGAASYPGLRELAVFACAGVAAAVAVTLLVIRPWLAVAPNSELGHDLGAVPSAQRASVPWGLARLHGVTVAAMDCMARSQVVRVVASLSMLASVTFIAITAPRIEFVDDVGALSRVSPTWLLEDQLVRRDVGRFDAGRFVVVRGATMEEALERNDAVARRLELATAAGVLSGYRSLHTFLWSESLQRRNLAALDEARDAGLASRAGAALSAAGLRVEAFAAGLLARDESSTSDAAQTDDPRILRWAELVDSPLAPLVKPFVVELDGGAGVAITSHVRGVTDVERLRGLVEAVEGARTFDRRHATSTAWQDHRVRIVWAAGVGFACVTLLVFARYRQIGKTIRAVLPALLAAGFTSCVRTLVGPPLHLLDVVAALLVLAIGADYGVFLVEAAQAADASDGRATPPPRDEVASTLVAILLAFATTLCGFGTLALASNPAMQAIGITTGIGVAAALGFAVLVHGATSPWLRTPAPPPGPGSGPAGVRSGAGARASVLGVLVVVGVTACGGHSEEVRPPVANELGLELATLPYVAALRQSVVATRGDERHAVEVALELDAERVVLVGVLPFGGRAFSLIATAAGTDATVHLPGRVPVDPNVVARDLARAIVVDAAGVWSNTSPVRDRRRGRSSFGRFHERWDGSCLVERRFRGRDPLVVTYEDPWCPGRLPQRIRLEHPRMGLVIRVNTIAGETRARAR